ncbi:MAG: ComF family protein [Clostridiales bacterium]|nr:ComF family protein [Clostridiales bacterium]
MKLLNLIYPKAKCSNCNNNLYQERAYLCELCEKDLESYQRDVEIVGEVVKGYILYKYDGIVKELIIRFKYKQHRYLGKYFASIMFERLQKMPEIFDVILPVPSHWQRKYERGFNQTEVIAKELSQLSGFPYDFEILKRVKANMPLKKLNKEERAAILNDIFTASNEKKYRVALLIDDIYTTGTTIQYCSMALYEAGFDQIIFIAFCGNY